MKVLTVGMCAYLLSACLFCSCQRNLSITTPEGTDIYVQGNHIAVMDSNAYFRNYYLKDAYKKVNYQGDIYKLLSNLKDPVAKPKQ
ncbi:MAG: hypothetical protein V4714_19355 [Bacteroidota bacterium]